MSFKKIQYGSGEGLVKIKVEEDTGAIIERWTIMMSDLGNWFRVMKKKYGNRVESKKDNRDLDWLK